MLRSYVADLHVHTALSPCASYRMAPTVIVNRALRKGLDILAVTDHNSSENVVAVIEAAASKGIRILPGMEVESREEVHLVVLFDHDEQALSWQEFVYAHLPLLANDERVYGAQLVLGPTNEFIRKNERRLIMATDLSIDTIVAEVTRLGGFCIPAHVDRPSHSVIANLGFIPAALDLPAVELSANARLEPPYTALGKAVLRSSDAHDDVDIGGCRTKFLLAEPTVREIELACRGGLGRKVLATKGSGEKSWKQYKSP